MRYTIQRLPIASARYLSALPGLSSGQRQGNPVERRLFDLRTYELAIVMRGDLTDEDRASQMDTIQGWITTHGGSVAKVDHWGRRRLAYPIRNQRDGYYAIVTAELPAEAPSELERNLRIAENVLRFLVIRTDE
jgi:small subunit ribosomal protein S6